MIIFLKVVSHHPSSIYPISRDEFHTVAAQDLTKCRISIFRHNIFRISKVAILWRVSMNFEGLFCAFERHFKGDFEKLEFTLRLNRFCKVLKEKVCQGLS